MSDLINTKSYMYSLYAARRKRVGNWIWTDDDVLGENTNVCHYVRNAAIEASYRCTLNLLKFIGGLVLCFMILTPILSVGFWLFTDNPFIIWFGDFGKAMLAIDAIVVALCCLGGIFWAADKFGKQTSKAVNHISAVKLTTSWVRGVHGKFCVPLKFDKEPKNLEEEAAEDAEKWDRE